jgi:hypothetical protein
VGVLKEKFNSKLVEVKQALYKPYFQAEECEKIADDYAIDFAKWVQFHSELWIKYKTSELLEIYKKEKGL